MRSETITFSGDRLNTICDEGYSPKSNLMPLCLNGSWQSDYKSLCEESKYHNYCNFMLTNENPIQIKHK